jgi:hypothetical protein
MGKVTLEAMLRRAARMAEQTFEKHGGVDAFWLVETAGGDQFTLVTPMTFPEDESGTEFKESMARYLREEFKTKGVVRYACAMEAWQSPEDDTSEIEPRLHPRRDEIVWFEASDGARLLQGTRKIIRPAGRSPYLEPIVTEEHHASSEHGRGRFSDMLRDRRWAVIRAMKIWQLQNWEHKEFAEQACAEIAFAKAMGVPRGLRDFPDHKVLDGQVIAGYRVRRAPDGLVIIPSDDDNEKIVAVLADIENKRATVLGWITAREAKHPKYHRLDGFEYWIVPPEDLRTDFPELEGRQ